MQAGEEKTDTSVTDWTVVITTVGPLSPTPDLEKLLSREEVLPVILYSTLSTKEPGILDIGTCLAGNEMLFELSLGVIFKDIFPLSNL